MYRPTGHWQALAKPPFNILSNFDRIDDAIDANADIAADILSTALRSFGLEESPGAAMNWHDTATSSDMDKARSTIRQLYRDWSAEGSDERRACYDPILRDLEHNFRHVERKASIKVLVPGAGLGRLVYEVCYQGFTVEGNEISYHQLIASSWVLNHVQPLKQHDLYPFALDFSNVIDRQDQLKLVKIPDIHPGTELGLKSVEPGTGDRMSMTASDFLVLYSGEEHAASFDAVATVFFIDTAPNVFRYIETVRNCLKEGGLWINLGPLLWHFADRGPTETDRSERKVQRLEKTGIEEAGSIELTEKELLLLVKEMGFEIDLHENGNDQAGYMQNPQSMLQNIYKNSHWIARKKSRR